MILSDVAVKRPVLAAVISLLFGFSDGFGLPLQQYIPSQFASMAPYVATLVALYIYSVKEKKKKA